MPDLHATANPITRTSTITLHGSLAQVFPLFNPVREQDWAAGWAPHFLTPVAVMAEHLVFRTPAPLGHGEPDYVWTLSKYAPEPALIEYTVFTPERVWWITIQCRAASPAPTTQAEITYTFVGLTDKGHALNAKALQVMYAHDLKDWERAINHYLATGERLAHH